MQLPTPTALGNPENGREEESGGVFILCTAFSSSDAAGPIYEPTDSMGS